jgi:hypothetical protein
VDDDAHDEWKGRLDPAWRNDWRDLVQAARAAGKTMSRVHAVELPLSPYLQFELEAIYPHSVAAGEEVRIIVHEAPDLIGPDFWLLDDTVCLMQYDADGNWLGVDLFDGPEESVAQFKTWRDNLLRDSTPLAEFGLESRRTA